MVRILHSSDIHFGPPHRPAAAFALLELCAERRPDAFVVSGDLTQRAKKYQFRQAQEFLDAAPVPAFAVPGNHDVPMYRFWERIAAPYGAYRRHFSAILEPRLEIPGAWIAGINTAFNWTQKGGRITATSLRNLREDAAGAAPDAVRIVVAHHPLLLAAKFRGERRMPGDREALRCFAELGVELVLSGHAHQFFLGHPEEYGFGPQLAAAREGSAGLGPERDLVVVHSGTSSSNRWRGEEVGVNSCNWIEITEREIVVQNLRFVPGGRASGAFALHESHTWPRFKPAVGALTDQSATENSTFRGEIDGLRRTPGTARAGKFGE